LAVAAVLFAGSAANAGDIPSNPSRAVPVLRMVIQYSDGNFSELSRRPLRKVLPPSDELPAVQQPEIPLNGADDGLNDLPAVQLPSGFWFEVVLGDGSVKYRRILENPILLTFEGLDPEDTSPERALTRVESLPKHRVFSLLVPFDQQGPAGADLGPQTLVLFSSPLRPGAQAEPASAIARLPLSDPIIIASVQED